MRCPHCHRKIPEQAVYCGACGRRVAGWEGKTQGSGRPTADSQDDTEKVRPDSALLRAAGRDPEATRRLGPDSELLRVVRGSPTPTRPEGPTSSLVRAATTSNIPDSNEDGDRNDPTDVISTGLQSRIAGPGGDTAFMVDAALRRSRSRLVLLMVANACLLAVGIYLIVTWAERRERESRRSSATAPPRTRAYVNWDDDGQGLIATAPVRATYPTEPKTMPPVMKPMDMDAMKPMGMEPIKPMDMDTMKPMGRSPEPPMRRPGADVAERRSHLAALRRAFLKQVAPKVRARQADVRRCYKQTLTLLGRFRGFLDVQFQVGPDGRVIRARTTRNTTGSKALGSCIAAVIQSIRFPRPPGGAVSLLYPFRFMPKKR